MVSFDQETGAVARLERTIEAPSIHSSTGTQSTVGGAGGHGQSGIEWSSGIHNDSGESKPGGASKGSGNSSGEKISKQETRAVLKVRLYVILVLIIVSTAVCILVYYITSHAETEEFGIQYDGAAEKVIKTFEGIINRVGSVNSVAIAATAYGLDNGLNWPFITLTSFQQRSATARLISDTLLIQLLPLVTDENRWEWEKYVVGPDKAWIEEGIQFQEEMDLNRFEYNPPPMNEVLMTNYTSKPIFYYNDDHEAVIDEGPGPYLPRWEMSPVIKKKMVNENLFRIKSNNNARNCFDTGLAVFGDLEFAPIGSFNHTNETTAFFSTMRSIRMGEEILYAGAPFASLFLPVFDTFDHKNRSTVAVMKSMINWRNYFENVLPSNIKGITAVLKCGGGAFTYELNGPVADAIGRGDLHDAKFDQYVRTLSLEDFAIADGTKEGLHLDSDGCFYHIAVYPSQKFYDDYITMAPLTITISVALVFSFTIFMFLVYDRLVERRQKIVLNKAVVSTAIVSSLFPKKIQEQLIQQREEERNINNRKASLLGRSQDNRLKTFLVGYAKGTETDISGDIAGIEASQMADLFPHCTVLFADIAGFTAWSSTREPTQVFVLLQSIYQCFDRIAKKRKVFKVETIGDCYLAVTGLPDPQPKHYLIMARFAWECKQSMNQLARELEVTLGPGTGELAMRIGMHSGQVTAGVLKGDRTRFQLFGDTVNTASRMESTGIRDKIQISQTTADLLIASGKEHWLRSREDKIVAKGKGEMQTYWLLPVAKKASSTTSSIGKRESSDEGASFSDINNDAQRIEIEKTGRLVDWMVELLLEPLRKMFAARPIKISGKESTSDSLSTTPGTICLDEVRDVIDLEELVCHIETESSEESHEEVGKDIVLDLRLYLSTIASLYRKNPFHNFEHACHVTMSVNKLLRRLVSNEMHEDNSDCLPIFSNPLVAFSIYFSAIVHDVDHRGCSNAQLISEQPQLGAKYRYKSVAEQNSLDVAWNLLMEERFDRLRNALFNSQEELRYFREILVNAVLATDIFDKEFNDLRKTRWTKAFSEEGDVHNNNRKATIVIEHIIQASDVSHTMQHWQVYRKWNKLLFREMYTAYRTGRLGVDPSTFWYQGELSFFDNYVIPLAKKQQECHLFGVTSDENLNYAVCNRLEWASRGEAMIEEIMIELAHE